MDAREAKALEIAARMRLTFKNGVWLVPSQSGQGTYSVVLKPDGNTCDCEDFALRGKDCKHIFAALFVCERDYGGKALLIDTDTLPVKKTYKQDWPAYNEAQTTEKKRFQILLHQLCERLPAPKQPWTGRRRAPWSDLVFAICFKVYSTVSSRRFSCDLQDAHEKGYLSRSLHFNSINGCLEDAELTPLLKTLIVQSSLPLKAVETNFAVDSTGFSTSRFVKWFDHKYGCVRQEHDWVKVHLVTGVKTNVVTAVEIHGRDAGDSPLLPALVGATAENFKIGEVSADKGYLSVENIESVFAHGGTPFIAFKVNSTSGQGGGLWERMFHYYSFNREEFLAHYHKRSNVESTFSMIKAKFRDHVRSRTDVSMRNEVLAKIVCHNLCVVIQSQCELGIEPVFWPADPNDRPDVLPMARHR